jgi:oligopeptide transport system ATP-binding protein
MSVDVETPLLEARNVVQEFPVSAGPKGTRGVVHAVSDVSFELRSGETLGIVGESGAGKTTLVRTLLQMPRPTSGSVLFRNCDLARLRGRRLREQRRHMQMVYQDPTSSLNPKWRVSAVVEEPLIGYGLGSRAERRRRVAESLELVGLPSTVYGRLHPKELSGGQCQRVAIARAIAPEAAMIICDEVVSSLDSLIQAEVLCLFEDLRARLGVSYIFISHDLAVVRRISHRVAVMYLGQLCEIGPVDRVYADPAHPYTRALLATFAPLSSQSDTDLAENINSPSPIDPPTGCRFRTRCPRAQDLCALQRPSLRPIGDGQAVACHFPVSGGKGTEAASPWFTCAFPDLQPARSRDRDAAARGTLRRLAATGGSD